MSANINLVNKQGPEDSRAEKIKKIKGISFAVLAITALFAIIIFGVDYRFSASYVKKQQTDLLNEVSKYQDTSAKIFVVNSKLSDISTILEQRKKYNTQTSQIVGASPEDVSIDDYLVNETGITFTASSNSLASIDSFLNSLLKLSEEKVIAGVFLKRLTFNSSRYEVEISTL